MDVTLCMLGNFSCVLPSTIFQNKPFSEYSFRNTVRESNSLVPDQAQPFVGPDLGSKCLQWLSADDTSKQGVKVDMVFGKVN